MNESIAYVIYDLSIEDLTARKEQARVFTSGRKLQVAIGINQNHIPLYTNPVLKKRYRCKKDSKEYAIRVFKG